LVGIPKPTSREPGLAKSSQSVGVGVKSSQVKSGGALISGAPKHHDLKISDHVGDGGLKTSLKHVEQNYGFTIEERRGWRDVACECRVQ